MCFTVQGGSLFQVCGRKSSVWPFKQRYPAILSFSIFYYATQVQWVIPWYVTTQMKATEPKHLEVMFAYSKLSEMDLDCLLFIVKETKTLETAKNVKYSYLD